MRQRPASASITSAPNMLTSGQAGTWAAPPTTSPSAAKVSHRRRPGVTQPSAARTACPASGMATGVLPAQEGRHRGARLREGRQAERCAQLARGVARAIQALAFDHDAGRRTLERLHIGHRQPHVLEPQRLQRLEAEHVADDRGRQVGDRAGLEQIEVVGDGKANHCCSVAVPGPVLGTGSTL